MFAFPQREPTPQELDSVKNLANEVYAKLGTGSDYVELCKQYSSDRQSAGKNGNLGWVQTGMRYPQPFMDAIFSLKDTGEYTTPIQTAFGFHIIKLNDKKPRESWEEAKGRILQQLASSDLSEEVSALKIADLAKEVKYETDKKAYESLMQLANTYFPLDSNSISITSQDQHTLLTVDDQTFSVADFTEFLQKYGNFRYNVSTDFVAKSYENFVLAKLREVYMATLGDRYPEYRNLLNEYHDGILLFNVMNEEVWEKAANDTLALTNYFAAYKDKYKWDTPRYKGLIINCKDEETLNKAKELAAKSKEALDLDVILKTALNNDSTSRIAIRKGLWAKGENKFIDAAIFQSSVEPDLVPNFPLYFVEGKLLNEPEEYTDAKGLVISDYQEIREKEWMQSLRNKYKVEINKKALKSIK
jgi:peptidyl-prolyl cis-trans isomerase SurA